MRKEPSVTRIEALKIARYLGCADAHETESGWMPCADHETLMAISQRAEKSLMSTKKTKRRRRSVRSREGWEQLTEKPVVGIDTLADGSLVSAQISLKAAEKVCPPATTSIPVNLRNRRKAIQDANYGPLNPNQPNTEYWKKIAEEWQVSPAEAKKQRCGNCAAFIKTPEMLSCIEAGIGKDKDSWSVIDSGDLGFCEFFDFKCASKRTCSAWVVGGPVTTTKKSPQEEKSLSERRVNPSDPDVFGSPESARKRARQLGCIGIRRYSTTEGDSAWMPCTNESDYRRKLGTSPQGRIDIAKNQMRQMRLAIGKMQQKSLGAKTPAPPKDRVFGSERNKPGTAGSRSAAANIKLSDATIVGLRRSLSTHNKRMDELNKPSWTRADLNALKAVYQRGAGAYSTSHRPNVTRAQWAMGRVRAFLWMLEHGKPRKLTYIGDVDLLPTRHPFRQSRKSIDGLLPLEMFEALEQKGLGRWLGRARRSMPRGGRFGRRITDKPEYDGDSDNMITNPLTGKDEIPWHKGKETPEEAMKRFFGGKVPISATPIGTPIGKDSPRRRTRFWANLRGRSKQKPPKRAVPLRRAAQSPGRDNNKFPKTIVDTNGRGEWTRDDYAVRLGKDWIPAGEMDSLELVPPGTNMSSRRWNGLPDLIKILTLRADTKSRIMASEREWEQAHKEIAIRQVFTSPLMEQLIDDEETRSYMAMTPEEREAFDDVRSLTDPDYSDPLERFYVEALENAQQEGLLPPNFDQLAASDDEPTNELDAIFADATFAQLSRSLSPRAKFSYDLWRHRRAERRKNPSKGFLTAGVLDDGEMWLWLALASKEIQAKLNLEKEAPGYSPIDGVSEQKYAQIISDAIQRNAPAVAQRNDWVLANTILGDLLDAPLDGSDEELADMMDEDGYDSEQTFADFEQGFTVNMLPLEPVAIPTIDDDGQPNPWWFDDAQMNLDILPMDIEMHNTDDPDYRPYLPPEASILSSKISDSGEELSPMDSLFVQSLEMLGADAINGVGPDEAPLSTAYKGSDSEMLAQYFRDLERWFSDIMREYMTLKSDPFSALTLTDNPYEVLQLLALQSIPQPLAKLGLDESIGPDGFDTDSVGLKAAISLNKIFRTIFNLVQDGDWDPNGGDIRFM